MTEIMLVIQVNKTGAVLLIFTAANGKLINLISYLHIIITLLKLQSEGHQSALIFTQKTSKTYVLDAALDNDVPSFEWIAVMQMLKWTEYPLHCTIKVRLRWFGADLVKL